MKTKVMFGIVLPIVMGVLFSMAGAQENTCPDDNGWTKIDSGDLSAYPVVGATQYCFKAGSDNSQGCKGGLFDTWPVEGACGLSHWSYFVPEATEESSATPDPTSTGIFPTDTPDPTLTDVPSDPTPTLFAEDTSTVEPMSTDVTPAPTPSMTFECPEYECVPDSVQVFEVGGLVCVVWPDGSGNCYCPCEDGLCEEIK